MLQVLNIQLNHQLLQIDAGHIWSTDLLSNGRRINN
jgi:hypothetical protein